MDMVFVWLIVFAVAFIVELLTMELTTIWFALGALITMGLAFIPGFPLWAQVLVFGILSVLMLILLRKIFLKKLNKGELKTSVESLVGKKLAVKTATSEEAPATVRVNGVVWNALEKAEQNLIEGDEVEVLEVKGNKLIVKK